MSEISGNESVTSITKSQKSPKDEINLQDVVEVFVPEKYRKTSKICMSENENLLLNFYSNLNNIRKSNPSFRDITLNHILILVIRENHGVNEKLHLNLGLNPYLRFNDYYISKLNCIDINEPILVFNRFKKFNPYKNEFSEIHNTTYMSVRTQDVFGWENLKDNFDVLEDSDSDSVIITNYKETEKEKVWMVQNTTTIDKSDLYNQIKHLENLKNDFIIQSKLTDLDPNPYAMSEYDFHNICVWKYHSFEYPTRKKAFEWSQYLRPRIYDLVKSFSRIRKKDFLSVMRIHYESLDQPDADKRELLYTLGYNEIIDKMMDKMKTISGTSLCYEEILEDDRDITLDETIPMSKLRLIINDYIIQTQRYIFEGDHRGIMKYIRKNDLSYEVLENEKMYVELLNDNLFCVLENGLEDYSKEVVNSEQYQLQTPDIYILLGFYMFPCFFSKELWEKCDFSKQTKWRYVIQSMNFLETTYWYYMYGLCCFFAQVIGPSYYIYNYYLIDNNDFCPNKSTILNKFFAMSYYLVLYARMNSFWRSLTTCVWQYGNTTIITSDNYLRLTLIVNSICLYIVPLFTYTLFIELSNITDLILNCLTGEFLINIDNLIVEFIGEEDYIRTLTKDLLIYSFLKTGYPTKNIMEGNTSELWVITTLQVIQMFGTLVMTGIVYKCI